VPVHTTKSNKGGVLCDPGILWRGRLGSSASQNATHNISCTYQESNHNS